MRNLLLAAVLVLASAASADEPAASAKQGKKPGKLLDLTVNPKLPKRPKPARVVPQETPKVPEAAPGPDPKMIPNACADDLSCRAMEGAAKGRLGSLRSVASIYYGDTEGSYPASLDALVPKHIDAIPAIQVGGHAKTNAVRIVTKAGGKSAGPYLKDTGGWVYFHTPGNPDLDGTVVIDCVHADYKGRPLWGF